MFSGGHSESGYGSVGLCDETAVRAWEVRGTFAEKHLARATAPPGDAGRWADTTARRCDVRQGSRGGGRPCQAEPTLGNSSSVRAGGSPAGRFAEGELPGGVGEPGEQTLVGKVLQRQCDGWPAAARQPADELVGER
jgi:hypothetical protein